MSKRLLRILLPVAVVLGAVIVLVAMVKTRAKPIKVETPQLGPLVSYVTLEARKGTVLLPAKGTVTAAESVTLGAEVAGRVAHRSPNLVPGGRLRKGEVLLRLDPRDYTLAVEQQRAAVDRAQLELELERSRQEVAGREWELLSKAGGAPLERPKDAEVALALRGPQVRTAKASLAGAQSAVDRAKLALERTTIRAPFDAVVQTVSVEVGQVVSPMQPLATLVGTDMYWVQVNVPVEWLVWLTAADGTLKKTPVTVRASLGATSIERQGHITRLLGDVDPVGRMARVLVEILDPLGRKAAAARPAGGPPILPILLGSYVHVDVASEAAPDLVAVPNRAMREGRRVYLMDAHSKLAIRDVEVVFRTDDTTYVRGGVQPGDKAVVSGLATPLAGMLLRGEPDQRAAERTP